MPLFSNYYARLIKARDYNARYLLTSEIAGKPVFHPVDHIGESPALQPGTLMSHKLVFPHQQQAYAGGEARIAHHLRQTAHILRHAQTHRHVENLFGQLNHPLHLRRATTDHDARRQDFFKTRPAQLGLHQRIQLFHPGLDHLGQRCPRHLPRAAIAHARQHASSNNWDQRFHFMDYMLYAYLQLGETGKAWDIVQQVQAIGNAQPSNTTVAYAYAAIPARYTVERGDWHGAAKLHLHPADFPWQQFGWCEAIIHFARGLGAAKTGNVTDAKDSLQRLEALRDLDRSAQKHYTAGQIEIQRLAVAAWITAAENRNEEALRLMRASAALEDSTEKDNVTPGAVIPARELLGELLLTLNQPAAALQELEASLQRTPNRRNALYRAAQAAREAGDQAKAQRYERQYQQLPVFN